MLRVKDQLNASTEHVLNETLSRVITLDGISAPDALPFHIPVAWIPASMYKKAFLIIDSAERTILCRVIATGCAVAPASPERGLHPALVPFVPAVGGGRVRDRRSVRSMQECSGRSRGDYVPRCGILRFVENSGPKG